MIDPKKWRKIIISSEQFKAQCEHNTRTTRKLNNYSGLACWMPLSMSDQNAKNQRFERKRLERTHQMVNQNESAGGGGAAEEAAAAETEAGAARQRTTSSTWRDSSSSRTGAGSFAMHA